MKKLNALSKETCAELSDTAKRRKLTGRDHSIKDISQQVYLILQIKFEYQHTGEHLSGGISPKGKVPLAGENLQLH